MEKETEARIIKAIGAKSIGQPENIQRLWSGYGEIVRYKVEGRERTTA